MTTGVNIFCDKTEMPAKGTTEIGTPVRVRQATESPAGALTAYSCKPEGMQVANVSRPRRGHDY